MKMEKTYTAWLKFKNGNYFWLGDVTAKNKTAARRKAHGLETMDIVRNTTLDNDSRIVVGYPLGFKTFDEKTKWSQEALRDARYGISSRRVLTMMGH